MINVSMLGWYWIRHFFGLICALYSILYCIIIIMIMNFNVNPCNVFELNCREIVLYDYTKNLISFLSIFLQLSGKDVVVIYISSQEQQKSKILNNKNIIWLHIGSSSLWGCNGCMVIIMCMVIILGELLDKKLIFVFFMSFKKATFACKNVVIFYVFGSRYID